jgi:K(+)-stimulated pyrophosphate-energized sodium pump
MANAGGAWDNAKKLVEVDLREKNTPLHAATVVGDTVGDPFKDTTSVALNPIIKFSTLFGLLAVEIAVGVKRAAAAGTGTDFTTTVGIAMLAAALFFVWRSFYAMRIPLVETDLPQQMAFHPATEPRLGPHIVTAGAEHASSPLFAGPDPAGSRTAQSMDGTTHRTA